MVVCCQRHVQNYCWRKFSMAVSSNVTVMIHLRYFTTWATYKFAQAIQLYDDVCLLFQFSCWILNFLKTSFDHAFSFRESHEAIMPVLSNHKFLVPFKAILILSKSHQNLVGNFLFRCSICFEANSIARETNEIGKLNEICWKILLKKRVGRHTKQFFHR